MSSVREPPVYPLDARPSPVPIAVAEWDAVPIADAAAELLPCCASKAWVNQLILRRPHRSLSVLSGASGEILAALGWDDLSEALAAHPRIGQRAGGQDRESAWSRQEQAGAAGEPAVSQQLREANVAYEDRFGHVFLICATGLSAAQILANLEFRLGNDETAERLTVAQELSKIVDIRLAKTFY